MSRYRPSISAEFFAGMELSILHLGLWSLSLPVRAGLLRSLRPFAWPMLRIAQWLLPFGSDRGAMFDVGRGNGDALIGDVRMGFAIADGFDPQRILLVALGQRDDRPGHGRVGWLLLGARPDGSQFGSSERDVIEDIAEPVARAVQVALSREEREARYERRFTELEQRLNAIAERLTRPSASRTSGPA